MEKKFKETYLASESRTSTKMTACCRLSPIIRVASVSGLLVADIGPADGGSRGKSEDGIATRKDSGNNKFNIDHVTC